MNTKKEVKQMETTEYYGGLYPEPPETKEENTWEEQEEYEEYMADIVHDEMILGGD